MAELLHHGFPLADFSRWLNGVIAATRPDLVIGIARGAIRLLQLASDEEDVHVPQFVTQHALPFFQPRDLTGKRVLVFDDSVVFGSTLSNVHRELQRRGALTFCAAYVVESDSFLGTAKRGPHSHIDLQYRHLLNRTEIRRHHTSLVRTVLAAGRHYNLEFPTLCLRFRPFSISEIPRFCDDFLAIKGIAGVYDLTPAASAGSGVYRFSALLSDVGQLGVLPSSKLRITMVPEAGEIRVTGLAQLSLELEQCNVASLTPAGQRLADCWGQLERPASGEPAEQRKATFRLATAFASLSLVQSLIAKSPLVANSDVSLLTEDLRLVVGSRNAALLESMRSELSTSDVETFDWRGPGSDHPDVDALAAVRTHLAEQPAVDYHTSVERLTQILLAVRQLVDSDKARSANESVSRLDFGLTPLEFLTLISERGGGISSEEVSLALDVCIDAGQAVPRVVERNGRMRRVFSVGEVVNSEDLIQFKLKVYEAYSEHLTQKRARPLTPYHLQKLTVILRDLLGGKLPILTEYSTFGRTGWIGEESVVRVLTKRGGPLKRRRDGKRDVLLPNSDFASVAYGAWPPDFEREFLDDFGILTNLLTRVSPESALLLSTCRTHRHAFNATAEEVHRWTYDAENSFGSFLEYCSGRQAPSPDAYHALYLATRYVSEAEKKDRIFHRKFKQYSDRLAEACEKLGPSAKRFWKLGVLDRGFLDPTIVPEIVWRFESLRQIVALMKALTSFSCGSLLSLDTLDSRRISEEFQQRGVGVRDEPFAWVIDENGAARSAYERAIESNIGTSLGLTPLPHEDLVDPAAVLSAAGDAFSKIRRGLKFYCPRYKVVEGDFPYSPTGLVATLLDGGRELRLLGHYILAIDLYGSFGNPRGAVLKERIQGILRSCPADLFHETTGNDCLVMCCASPQPLWEIAQSINVESASVGLEGARKGMMVGDLTVHITADQETILKDTDKPHMIAQTTSLFSASDNFADRNQLVVVDARSIAHLQRAMGIHVDSHHEHMARGKHFTGRCYCVDLRSKRSVPKTTK